MKTDKLGEQTKAISRWTRYEKSQILMALKKWVNSQERVQTTNVVQHI